jgi:hypothetical protein
MNRSRALKSHITQSKIAQKIDKNKIYREIFLIIFKNFAKKIIEQKLENESTSNKIEMATESFREKLGKFMKKSKGVCLLT